MTTEILPVSTTICTNIGTISQIMEQVLRASPTTINTTIEHAIAIQEASVSKGTVLGLCKSQRPRFQGPHTQTLQLVFQISRFAKTQIAWIVSMECSGCIQGSGAAKNACTTVLTDTTTQTLRWTINVSLAKILTAKCALALEPASATFATRLTILM